MGDDQQQEQAVEGAWVRIEAWLRRNAPRSYRMLPPPAPRADIHAVEQELDLVIPPGLRAFYRLHNGTGHPADFGWTPEPETGLPPQGQGTAWLLPKKHAIPPVQHVPYWDEGPHTIGRPVDPADYLIEVADALYEYRGVEYADGHQDASVPGRVDHALVWDRPLYPLDPDWTRFAQRRAARHRGATVPPVPLGAAPQHNSPTHSAGGPLQMQLHVDVRGQRA